MRPVSVLVPMHNEAALVRPFLDELYAKCLNQLTDFEVIMLEDGSADGTDRVIHECEGSVEKARPVLVHPTEG